MGSRLTFQRTIEASALIVLAGCDSGAPTLQWDIAFDSRSLGTRAAMIEARIAKGGCVSEEIVYVSSFAADGTGSAPPRLADGTYGFMARAQDGECLWYAQGCTEVEVPRDRGPIMVRLTYLSDETLDCDRAACRSAQCRPIAQPEAGLDAGGDDDAGAPELDAAPAPEPILFVLEAEAADPLHWPLERHEDPSALGGAYIGYAYDPAQPLEERQGLKRATPPADDAPDGLAILDFEVPRSDRYRIWGRVITPTLDEDSFWLRIDDEPWIQWNDIAHFDQWGWVDVRPFEQRIDRYPVELSAGPHVLRISYRELGARLDQLLFASDEDFVPTD